MAGVTRGRGAMSLPPWSSTQPHVAWREPTHAIIAALCLAGAAAVADDRGEPEVDARAARPPRRRGARFSCIAAGAALPAGVARSRVARARHAPRRAAAARRQVPRVAAPHGAPPRAAAAAAAPASAGLAAPRGRRACRRARVVVAAGLRGFGASEAPGRGASSFWWCGLILQCNEYLNL